MRGREDKVLLIRRALHLRSYHRRSYQRRRGLEHEDQARECRRRRRRRLTSSLRRRLALGTILISTLNEGARRCQHPQTRHQRSSIEGSSSCRQGSAITSIRALITRR